MTTALVLGGGGPVGVAWEVGLLAGLADAGVDLTTADRIIGTSAGSIVGARLALGQVPGDLAAAGPLGAGSSGVELPAVAPEAIAPVGVAMFEAMTGARPVDEAVAGLGTLSTSATTISEDDFVRLVTDGVIGEDWPDRDYACTAWDVESGEFRVWSKDSGVPMARAVASSCSVPGVFPPITIGGRRYMDGGVISASNAHLVSGADTVVVISVTSRIVPEAREMLAIGLDREVAALREEGATVEVIEFDDATAAACAGDLMSAATAHATLPVALAQGRAEAERIGAVWG